MRDEIAFLMFLIVFVILIFTSYHATKSDDDSMKDIYKRLDQIEKRLEMKNQN